jgi:benzoyl-CoA reductase/2-hydroxyglutaryl-CoA dehydratase subunit BcrC/BadD/HgdB
MTVALNALITAYHHPHQAVLDHHNHQLPVFGYLTENVPVELLLAADIFPVKIRGGRTADLASMHLQSFSCSYVRSVMHMAMNGEYDYLDGLISSKTCDAALHLFQIWEDLSPLKFSRLLSLPGNCDADAAAYFRKELSLLKTALEKFRNRSISDEKLSRAITLFNDIRKVIDQLWQRRVPYSFHRRSCPSLEGQPGSSADSRAGSADYPA